MVKFIDKLKSSIYNRKSKTILIATQSMGIGGAETYILTQVKEFLRQGNKVVILAKFGAYTNTLNDLGVITYDVSFEDNTYQGILKNVDIISNIIKKENIDEVHIHPFKTYCSVIWSSIKLNKPYILYFHGIDLKDIVTIEQCFGTLGIESNIFLSYIAFENSQKYIYISEEVKKFYEEKYLLNPKKGTICVNSLNHDLISKYKAIVPDITNTIKKFVIISRIDNDKFNSIMSSIEFFKIYSDEYKKRHNNEEPVLDIIGDGAAINELKMNINKFASNYNINLLGYSTNVLTDLQKYDVVLAMGRGILEAILCKKIPILVSYNGKMLIVNNSNYNNIKKTNFSGRNIELNDRVTVASELLLLDKKSMIKILEKNFKLLRFHDIINNIPFCNNMGEYTKNIQFKVNNFFEFKKKLED